jgi:hypothetical protein
MKVEQSGWYRTRDGRFAEVVVTKLEGSNYPVAGFIEDVSFRHSWARNGSIAFDSSVLDPTDLVEYLGKERPKERKTVKMAPALFYAGGYYGVTPCLYKSEQCARSQASEFVRWLIDTHSVTVEVDE